MAKSWQRLVLTTPPKIVTLIGMGYSSGFFVPDFHTSKRLYAREDHQVWAVNHAALWYNADLCCAMDDMERDRGIDREYVEALEERQIPVLTSKAYNIHHIEYPLWDVLDDVWGGEAIPPIDNTITAALGLCVHMKVEKIRCFGLDFCIPETAVEALHALARQRDTYPNCPPWFAMHERGIVQGRRDREPGHISSAFVCGVARSRGIEVEICELSTFMNADRQGEPFPNGYQDTKPLRHRYGQRNMKPEMVEFLKGYEDAS